MKIISYNLSPDMESAPLISIITITYNAAATIDATLDSVASQTFRNFEHIIVDGASSDDTLSRVSNYQDKIIVSEKDKGLYDAMNKGLRLAQGKYVLFLNSGDTFHSENTLKEYARRAEKNDDIIYGDTVIVDSKRHIIGKRHLTAPEILTFKSFSKGMLICHQAFMVKKEIAPQYDLSYRFSADYDWTVKCIKAADTVKCTNLNSITIDYLSEGLTDNNKSESLRERFRIMCKHYGTLPTIFNHITFLCRAIARRLSGQRI